MVNSLISAMGSRGWLSILFLLLTVCSSLADVALPSLFSDHMVLQKTSKAPIWGKAEAGEKVSATFGKARSETTADSNGNWRMALDLSQIEGEAGVLSVQGKNSIEIKDVLIGEVWVCSGQSNMEFPLSRSSDAEKEMASGANPRLREFKVKRKQVSEPSDECSGEWVVADPSRFGNFSAVGYYFGKKIGAELGVPVGLITTAVGATPIEAWTSYEALAQNPDLKKATDRDLLLSRDYGSVRKRFLESYRDWEKKFERKDISNEAKTPEFALLQNPAGWEKVGLPGPIKSESLSSPGAIWLVRTFDIPATDAGKEIKLLLGNPKGLETLYWNGSKIGGRTLDSYRGEGGTNSYRITGSLAKPGKNILAVRIFNAVEPPTLEGKLSHPGEWLAQMEFKFPLLSDEAKAALPEPLLQPPDPKQTASFLFNGMIYPLIPYAMAGVIWYQGENNAERAWQYRTAFPLLINDWRERWGQGDFPFYFCQLASYQAKTKKPGESDWAELREAQTQALQLPSTGQAILTDLGEAAEIHPRNKKDVGERLAAIALGDHYKKNIPFSGPTFKSLNVEGSKIRIQFSHADGGLLAKALPDVHWVSTQENKTERLIRNSPQSQLEGFAVCGADKQWVWANAMIEGDSVIVESPSVPTPLAVRYAWAKNPTCNLYNGAGFPAAPFRTDDFPAITAEKKY